PPARRAHRVLMHAAVSALQGFSQGAPAAEAGRRLVVVVVMVILEVVVVAGSDVVVSTTASHASPMQSPSASAWPALGTSGQSASWSGTPSPSRSGGGSWKWLSSWSQA